LYIGSFCPAITSLSRYLEKAAFSISITSSEFIFYGYCQGVLWTWFLLLFSFHVLKEGHSNNFYCFHFMSLRFLPLMKSFTWFFHDCFPPKIPILSRINPFLKLISVSLRSILILSSHLRLGLPKGLFPPGVSVKILKALLSSFILAT
jgi:hypothetical protein